ncbi:MAG: ABC transporter permease [Lachnospiraceae bacterium]
MFNLKKEKEEKHKPFKKRKNYTFIIGCTITAMILALTLIGFFYTPYDPEEMDASRKLAGISLSHIMGCDNFGRDIFSRVLKGCATTLVVAVGTVAIGTFFGLLIGAFTGYFGGVMDEVFMRIMDALFAFPSLLLALVFVSLLGRGKYQVIVALGIAFIPSFSRIVRSEYMRNRDRDYVKSARLAGASHLRIMFVHILPNIRRVLLASIMIGFNNAVLAEAGLTYMGIGVQPPDASLGEMLSSAQTYLFSAPWYALGTGLMIILMILGFGLMAEGLQKE